MSDKQREFVTAIIKIVFTIIFAGMAGGKLFNLSLLIGHYIFCLIALAGLFLGGYLIQGKEK